MAHASHWMQDEAVSVREAAVDLLGCHIGNDPELAAAYLDMLIQSSRDTGTSVRKRALTILWESCIRWDCCCNLVPVLFLWLTWTAVNRHCRSFLQTARLCVERCRTSSSARA
jgi:HEAT repeat associated with sister chromatid cohesion